MPESPETKRHKLLYINLSFRLTPPYQPTNPHTP